jgi:hypothetical protein
LKSRKYMDIVHSKTNKTRTKSPCYFSNERGSDIEKARPENSEQPTNALFVKGYSAF